MRPLTGADGDRLVRLCQRLSSHSRYLRYLTAAPSLSGVRRLSEVDGHRHVALALVDRDGELVGVARYIRLRETPRRAELAVEVVDEWQRRGLASVLLDRLTEHGRANGLQAFTATVSRENQPVLRLLRRRWPEARFTADGPLIEALLPLVDTAAHDSGDGAAAA